MHEELIGKRTHLIGRSEDFTPPTWNPDDYICGGKVPNAVSKNMIANCPCCAGVQILREEICNCEPDAHKLRVTLPPNTTTRIRYIDNVKGIE